MTRRYEVTAAPWCALAASAGTVWPLAEHAHTVYPVGQGGGVGAALCHTAGRPKEALCDDRRSDIQQYINNNYI